MLGRGLQVLPDKNAIVKSVNAVLHLTTGFGASSWSLARHLGRALESTSFVANVQFPYYPVIPLMEYVHTWNICSPELSLTYKVCLNPGFWNHYFRNGSRACYWWSTGDFCLLVSLRCQVYYASPITHVDKEQQGQRQDQRKNCHYFWPRFQSCTARCWIHMRLSMYFKHNHLPFWDKSYPNGALWAIAEHCKGFYLWTPAGFLVITDGKRSHLCTGVGNLQQRCSGQTQQQRWKEMCSECPCPLQQDLSLFL